MALTTYLPTCLLLVLRTPCSVARRTNPGGSYQVSTTASAMGTGTRIFSSTCGVYPPSPIRWPFSIATVSTRVTPVQNVQRSVKGQGYPLLPAPDHSTSIYFERERESERERERVRE
ncbi:hypothetical protein ASPBRDRAFT_343572 [Aspergillus brasiliensis CBS 101740]|uniref:Secreted protein n=1 Tax=Aspergillus brasiliensis (strain CBS 101740 / IMI 381727 / IBT 21946) TaxID=767769 RepID=A0A1L9U725_ASPBC|nr:hypothetical protein ASPBRDRAFT_343572 [Aspergillus brasiliensis CBS 101740]